MKQIQQTCAVKPDKMVCPLQSIVMYEPYSEQNNNETAHKVSMLLLSINMDNP